MRGDNQDSYEIISKSSRNAVLFGRRDDRQGRVFFFCFTRHTALKIFSFHTQHMKSFLRSGKQKNPPSVLKADFRVEKMDIPLLVVLGVPSMFKCRFRTIYNGCNNACILTRIPPWSRTQRLSTKNLDKIFLFKVSVIFSHILLLCMDPFFVWVLQWQLLYPG